MGQESSKKKMSKLLKTANRTNGKRFKRNREEGQ